MNRKNCIPFVVGCIYRPPDQPINNFIDNFSESLSKIDSGFNKVVPGDFNIDFSVGRRNANSSQKRLLKGISGLQHASRNTLNLLSTCALPMLNKKLPSPTS